MDRCLSKGKKRKRKCSSHSLLLSLLSSSFSSCHHIWFSSCNIPVFPKRIQTCGFDELTHSLTHTLSLFVPFFLFHCLILFSVTQSLLPSPDQKKKKMLHTAETYKDTCTNTTHLLPSFTGFPLVFFCSFQWSVS